MNLYIIKNEIKNLKIDLIFQCVLLALLISLEAVVLAFTFETDRAYNAELINNKDNIYKVQLTENLNKNNIDIGNFDILYFKNQIMKDTEDKLLKNNGIIGYSKNSILPKFLGLTIEKDILDKNNLISAKKHNKIWINEKFKDVINATSLNFDYNLENFKLETEGFYNSSIPIPYIILVSENFVSENNKVDYLLITNDFLQMENLINQLDKSNINYKSDDNIAELYKRIKILKATLISFTILFLLLITILFNKNFNFMIKKRKDAINVMYLCGGRYNLILFNYVIISIIFALLATILSLPLFILEFNFINNIFTQYFVQNYNLYNIIYSFVIVIVFITLLMIANYFKYYFKFARGKESKQ